MKFPKKKYYYKDYQVKYKRDNYKRVSFLMKIKEDADLIQALDEKTKNGTRNEFIVSALKKAVLDETESQN